MPWVKMDPNLYSKADNYNSFSCSNSPGNFQALLKYALMIIYNYRQNNVIDLNKLINKQNANLDYLYLYVISYCSITQHRRPLSKATITSGC